MSPKEQAEKLFNQGEKIATIAARLGVSRRTIERWAGEGAWREKRSSNVVTIKPKDFTADSNESPPPTRRRSRGGEIDELQIVNDAIGDVAYVLSGDIPHGAIGSCATALCRLIELRLKLKPRTAADLAELAIGLGMSPGDFARELRIAWEKRA